MLLLLTLALFGQTAPSRQTITYETKAKPIQAILADIGEQTHLKLRAGSDLANQPLIVSVHEAPVKEFFGNVAKATFGVWVSHGDTYELDLDAPRLQAAADAYHREQVARYQKVLQELSKQLAQSGPITADTASGMFGSQTAKAHAANSNDQSGNGPMGSQAPLQRAAIEALVAIGPDALADVGPMDRIVYSTNPSEVQRPIGGTSAAILEEYIAGATVVKAASDRTKANSPQSQESGMMSVFEGGGVDAEPEKTTKLILVLQKLMGMLDAQLYALHSDGKLGFPAMVPIVAVDEPSPGSAAKEDKPQQKVSITIDYSDDAKLVRSAFRGLPGLFGNQMFLGMSGFQRAPKLPDALKTKLCRPDQSDPLSYGDSEALIQYASSTGKQLIAELPDSAVGYLASSETFEDVRSALRLTPPKKISPENPAIAFDVLADPQIRASEDATWLTVSGSDPKDMLQNRMDRVAAANLLHAWIDPKASKTEALSAFFATRYAMDNTLATKYLALFGDKSGLENISVPLLGFYGNLSATNRQQLLSGAALEVGTLTSQACDALARAVYTCTLPLTDAPSDDRSMSGMESVAAAMPGLLGQKEPTELLPNGLPPETLVKIDLAKFKMARVPLASVIPPAMAGAVPEMPEMNLDLGPMELAAYKVMKSDPRFAKSMFAGVNLTNMRLLAATKLVFQFQFASKVFGKASLTDKSPLDDRLYGWNDLPSDLQQQMASQEANARAELAKLPADFAMPFMPHENRPPE